MKKILLIFLFCISCYSNEEKTIYEEKVIYDSDSVEYICKDGYVEANITFTDGTKDSVKVVWVNPKEDNKTVALECEDFYIWVDETEQR